MCVRECVCVCEAIWGRRSNFVVDGGCYERPQKLVRVSHIFP